MSAHRIGRCDDKYLQSGIIDRVKAHDITLRIAAFLIENDLQYQYQSAADTMDLTNLADLSKGADIPLNRDVTPIPSDIRHIRERARVDVAPAKMVE